MSQIVKCDICGKIYSQSYLGSHKRLSHGKRQVVPYSCTGESAMMETILSLFESLSEERKREVLSRLGAVEQTKP